MAFSIEYIYRVIDKMSPVFNKMAGTSAKFDKKLSSGLSSIENGLKRTGQKMANLQTGIASLGAGMALKELTNQTNEFNASMADVGTLVPGNQKRLQSLKKTVAGVAIDVGKNMGDISEGLFQVISAFGDMEGETTGRLKAVAKAATAGGASTVDSLNLLSAVTKGYGDTSAIALDKVSDLAFLTNKLGQTTFPELASSMGSVVPFAAKLQVSQEELFSTFGTLTGVTGNASEVSTQMRSVLVAMLKPTTDMQKAVAELGFESAASMIKQAGLGDSLKMLMKYTGGNEQEMAKLFGRAEALTGVFALTGSQAERYNTILGEMMKVNENVGAITQEAFLEITEGINKSGFSMQQLKTRIQELVISFGDELGPTINNFITKYANPFIKWLKELNPETKKNIVSIVAITAAIGAVLIPLGLMISTLGSLVGIIKIVTFVEKAWGIVSAFMTGLLSAKSVALNLTKGQIIAYKIGTYAAAAASKVWAVAQAVLNAVLSGNPIALVVIGIMALIAAIILAIKYWDKIVPVIKNVWSWITKVWDVIKGLIVIFGGPFLRSLTTIIEIIRSLVVSWENVKKAFTTGGILKGILAIGKAILAGLLSPIESFLNLVSKIPGVGNLAKGAAEKISKLKLNLQGLEIKIPEIPTPMQKPKQSESYTPWSPYSAPGIPIPQNNVNVNTKNEFSVYTEKDMKVVPYQKKSNVGYQMAFSGG